MSKAQFPNVLMIAKALFGEETTRFLIGLACEIEGSEPMVFGLTLDSPSVELPILDSPLSTSTPEAVYRKRSVSAISRVLRIWLSSIISAKPKVSLCKSRCAV